MSTAWKILSYGVMNPLWDLLQPSRLIFWVLFFGFPLALLGLAWVWKPMWALLRRMGIARWAGWGAVVGGLLAMPAAVYRGFLGGVAAGFGTYGVVGPHLGRGGRVRLFSWGRCWTGRNCRSASFPALAKTVVGSGEAIAGVD